MTIEIIFENESWCAVLKPANVLSVPARDTRDARPCLGTDLQTQLGVRIWPVHRLDFEVSGLILFAKTADAHRSANAWFESGTVQKTYQALSSDEPLVPDPRLHTTYDLLKAPAAKVSTLWSAPLVSGKRRSFAASHGKASQTRAEWESHPLGRLWQLEPLSGRSHQLRVHMAMACFPIRGDDLYGSKESFSDGIALRAVQLDFSKISETARLGLPAVIKRFISWR